MYFVPPIGTQNPISLYPFISLVDIWELKSKQTKTHKNNENKRKQKSENNSLWAQDYGLGLYRGTQKYSNSRYSDTCSGHLSCLNFCNC